MVGGDFRKFFSKIPEKQVRLIHSEPCFFLSDLGFWSVLKLLDLHGKIGTEVP